MANEPKRWRGLPRQLWKQGWFYTLVAAAAGGCVAVAAAVGQTDVGFILSGWSVFWFGLATSIFAAWIWLALAASRARGHHVPIRGAVTVFILLAAVSLTIATTTGDRRGSGYLIELELRNPLPAMMRTNYGDIAKLAQVRFRPGEPAVTEMERPHNLWMLVFGHVTIWNRSQERVSLQFEYETTVRGPVEDWSELTSNGGERGDSELDVVPITLVEHGPMRDVSYADDVFIMGGWDRSAHLEGPLVLDPGDHAQGPLAFYYHQHDRDEPRPSLAGGRLRIVDRLSGSHVTYRVPGLAVVESTP